MIVPECTGECCKAFPMSGHMGMVDISRLAAPNVFSGSRPSREITMIAGMVIPLSKFTTSSRLGTSPLFTCMYWSKETKKCGIHAIKPNMCQDYPYGNVCKFCGSTGGKK